MTAGERERRLQRLRDLDAGERALLANARCLGEGVDVPTLDGVAFIDPRRSQIDIVQAVGRAIRKAHATRRSAPSSCPSSSKSDDDPEVVLDSSAFKPVWDVLKALRAHDDTLAEELDSLRRGLGRREPGRAAAPEDPPRPPIGVGADFAHGRSTRGSFAQTTQPGTRPGSACSNGTSTNKVRSLRMPRRATDANSGMV